MDDDFKVGDRVRRKDSAMLDGSTWFVGRMTVTVSGVGEGMLTFEEVPGMWYGSSFEPEPIVKELTIMRNKVPTDLVPFIEQALKPGLAILGQEIGYNIKVIVEDDVFRFSTQKS